MANKLITIVIGLFAGLIIVIGGYLTMDSSEIKECQTWRGYATTLTDFYITKWQADQCEYHGIKINAPIK